MGWSINIFKRIIFVLCIFVISYTLFNCRKTTQAESFSPPIPSKLSGEQLAKTYCAGCHLFPEPSQLDKKTWQNGVLPKMYQRLGLENDTFKLLTNLEIDEIPIVLMAGAYPEHPVIAIEDWQKIVKYYSQNAPNELILSKNIPEPKLLQGFNLLKSKAIKDMPSITMLHIDTTNHQIYAGIRGTQNFLVKYNLKLSALDSTKIPSPITDIALWKGMQNWLLVGKMDPNDLARGLLINYNEALKNKKTLLDSLQRPVQCSYADITGDGIQETIICEFGNESGKLSWYDGKTKQKHILNYLPGNRNTLVVDMNADGMLDVVALTVQAREQVIIYYNRGNGHFEENTVLNFPAVWGSSYIQLADMDSDGLLDIIHTAGDNADLSSILKPYHGLRIYKNFGKNKFALKYFYPMYGASKAQVADFDLDGMKDIALISFFPDNTEKKNRNFILLKNIATFQFDSFNLPTIKTAKFMVMDVADADGDGDMDIILGSYLGKGIKMNIKLDSKFNSEIFLLENKSKKNL